MTAQDIDAMLPTLSLYHSQACWFCARVRHAMQDLGVDIALRDIDREPGQREDLSRGGGKTQVPCLRIDTPDGRTTWLYESADIIRYLQASVAR
jgi:glutathione S-transferase